MIINTIKGYSIFSLFLLISYSSISNADHSSSIEISDDIEIDILHIGSTAPISIIWFACNQGDETEEFKTARKLASQGYQFYFPDMLSAHFLSPTPSNIAKVPTDEVSKVVLEILKQTKSEQVYLIGGARSAVPVLKGLSSESIKQSSGKLKGALLITPRITSKTPEPGAEPIYIKEAGDSIHPILVLEGERTPNRWALPHLAEVLAKSGSTVQTGLIKGVRGFFYLRTEKTEEEVKMTQQLDLLIKNNIHKLGDSKQ